MVGISFGEPPGFPKQRVQSVFQRRFHSVHPTQTMDLMQQQIHPELLGSEARLQFWPGLGVGSVVFDQLEKAGVGKGIDRVFRPGLWIVVIIIVFVFVFVIPFVKDDSGKRVAGKDGVLPMVVVVLLLWRWWWWLARGSRNGCLEAVTVGIQRRHDRLQCLRHAFEQETTGKDGNDQTIRSSCSRIVCLLLLLLLGVWLQHEQWICGQQGKLIESLGGFHQSH